MIIQGLVLSAVIIASGPSVDAADTETPVEAALRRYPPTETNSAALDVERLAAPLGIELAPSDAKDRFHPSGEQIALFEKSYEVISTENKAELERFSGPIAPLSKVVSEFLDSHKNDLAAVRAGILRGEAPVWAESLDPASPVPRPRLVQLIKLTHVLVCDALAQEREGRTEIALNDLEASWKLAAALPTSPESNSRLAYNALVRLQCGALRRLKCAPRVWRDRIRAFSPMEAMLESLRLEATLSADAIPPKRVHFTGPFSWVRATAVRAYWRKCLEEATPHRLKQLDDVAAALPLCDAELDPRPPWDELSWWNYIGDGIGGGLVSLSNVSRVALDAEMTLKILDLRAARDENGGRWPKALPGIERSTNCPRDRWIYNVSSESMSLAFSRKLDWGQGPTILILPMRYEERRTEGSSRESGHASGR